MAQLHQHWSKNPSPPHLTKTTNDHQVFARALPNPHRKNERAHQAIQVRAHESAGFSRSTRRRLRRPVPFSARSIRVPPALTLCLAKSGSATSLGTWSPELWHQRSCNSSVALRHSPLAPCHHKTRALPRLLPSISWSSAYRQRSSCVAGFALSASTAQVSVLCAVHRDIDDKEATAISRRAWTGQHAFKLFLKASSYTTFGTCRQWPIVSFIIDIHKHPNGRAKDDETWTWQDRTSLTRQEFRV